MRFEIIIPMHLMKSSIKFQCQILDTWVNRASNDGRIGLHWVFISIKRNSCFQFWLAWIIGSHNSQNESLLVIILSLKTGKEEEEEERVLDHGIVVCWNTRRRRRTIPLRQRMIYLKKCCSNNLILRRSFANVIHSSIDWKRKTSS